MLDLLQQQQQQHRAPLVSLSITLLLPSPPAISSSFLKSPSSAAALPLSLFLVLAASTAGGLPIQQLLPQLASLRQLHPLFLHTAQHTHDTDTRSPRVGSLGRKAGRRATSRKERFAGLRGGFAGVALYTGLEQEGTFCQLSARLTLLRKESLCFTSFVSSLGWMPPPSLPLPPSLPMTQPAVLGPPKKGKRTSSSEASPCPVSSSTGCSRLSTPSSSPSSISSWRSSLASASRSIVSQNSPSGYSLKV